MLNIVNNNMNKYSCGLMIIDLFKLQKCSLFYNNEMFCGLNEKKHRMNGFIVLKCQGTD